MSSAKKNPPKNGNIAITQSFPVKLLNRLMKYAEARGFSSEQEAVRVIVATFLEKAGF